MFIIRSKFLWSRLHIVWLNAPCFTYFHSTDVHHVQWWTPRRQHQLHNGPHQRSDRICRQDRILACPFRAEIPAVPGNRAIRLPVDRREIRAKFSLHFHRHVENRRTDCKPVSLQSSLCLCLQFSVVVWTLFIIFFQILTRQTSNNFIAEDGRWKVIYWLIFFSRSYLVILFLYVFSLSIWMIFS